MDKLVEQLKRHEGFRAKPYKCTAGKWTIGYGFNLDAEAMCSDGLVVNEDMAEFLLKVQVSECVEAVSGSAGVPYNGIQHVRNAVLHNMCFNLGLFGLLKFKKMLLAFGRYDFETASKEMLDSKWAKQVGSRATELSEQMRTGEWQF